MKFNKNYLLGLFVVLLVCISTVNADVSYTHCAFKLPPTAKGDKFFFAFNGGQEGTWELAGPSEHTICLSTNRVCSINWKYDYESSTLQSIPDGVFRLGKASNSILMGEDGKIKSLKLRVTDYSWYHYNGSLFSSRAFWFDELRKERAQTINNEKKIKKMKVVIVFSNINNNPTVKLVRQKTNFGENILDDKRITPKDLESVKFLEILDIRGDQVRCETSDELIHGTIEDPEQRAKPDEIKTANPKDVKKSTQQPSTSTLRPASGLGSFNKPPF